MSSGARVWVAVGCLTVWLLGRFMMGYGCCKAWVLGLGCQGLDVKGWVLELGAGY